MTREHEQAAQEVRDLASRLAAAKLTYDQCERARAEAGVELEDLRSLLRAAEARLLNALHVEATGKDRERFQ